jgi:CheY-like chemotaxis protein
LRQRAPTVPIIAMSGHPGQSEELRRFATEGGANRFLFKPFTPDLLCQTVADILGQAAPAT